jgi:ribosome-binding factor A
MKSHRLARVSEVVRETAANAILFEIKDPRVKGVTVTRAEVSADLQHAKVFVSVMGTEKEQALAMHGLKSAAGFVQTKVAGRLTSRYVPHITFVLDEGVKKSIEIARLIREENERLAADARAAGNADETAADAEDAEEAEDAAADDDAEQPGPAAEGPADRPG